MSRSERRQARYDDAKARQQSHAAADEARNKRITAAENAHVDQFGGLSEALRGRRKGKIERMTVGEDGVEVEYKGSKLLRKAAVANETRAAKAAARKAKRGK